MGPPPHDRLLAYQRGLEAVKILAGVARETPGEWYDLRDQLRRAAPSITLNIAEGAAEFRPAEKARFYRMAIRSACECEAILDALAAVNAPARNDGIARAAIHEVAALTTRLAKSMDGADWS